MAIRACAESFMLLGNDNDVTNTVRGHLEPLAARFPVNNQNDTVIC